MHWFLTLPIKESQMEFGTSLYDSLRILFNIKVKMGTPNLFAE